MNKPESNFDFKKLDSFFSGEEVLSPETKKVQVSKHTKIVRMAKLLLPAIAAGILGLLIIYPRFSKESKELSIDITLPKKGELEKLHIENTTFYATDKSNNVHNFTATNIDETEPGSKLIKINNPEGIMPMSLATWFNVKSPTGYFNQEANTLTLLDDVEMFYSDGMTIEVPDMTFDFTKSYGYSDKPVNGTGFMGDIISEGFEFYSDTNLLVFVGKTHIVIKEESFKENTQ